MAVDSSPNAFPTSAGDPGMSLRDYFAARALEALLTRGYSTIGAPAEAYRIADAMLKARSA